MAEKTNSGKLKCKNCQSIVMLENVAKLVTVEDGITLPDVGVCGKDGANKSETFSAFWTVTDMFAFENVGFCNTVKNVKYLACADCEQGPIGAHFTDKTDKVYYVAPERVEMS